jgi:phosphonate C-P lyase system protein PhnH
MKLKHHFDMVMDTQAVFRLFLDALANPGRLVSIARYAGRFARQGCWLAPAVMLLDHETGFFWNGAAEIADEMRFLTGSAPVPIGCADFVFLPAPAVPAEIMAQVKQGSLEDPYDSALLLVATDEDAQRGNIRIPIILQGPGTPPEGRTVLLSQAECAWLEARSSSMPALYPRGAEIIFLRKDASVLAFTRKVALIWPM